MIRRLEWFRSFSERSGSLKKLPDAKLRPAKVKPEAMLDTVHEVAIYIHRFHNLDLFQQGWYQIKITLQREDGTSAATPARVVQYEAPSPGSDAAVYALWRIDNKDNSFSTQPFRIKYARQDVPFFIMVAFHLPLKKNEGPSSAAVIMKFELLFAEIWENGSEFQASIGSCPAAIHEFRIPPKALLGLHSYCPVHFDAFHSVLVDVTVHISLLKANKASPRVSSVSLTATEDVAAGESVLVSHQDQEQEADSKHILLVKALLSARDILLEELLRIGNGIGKVVDLAEFESKMNNMNILLLKLGIVDSEASGQAKPQNSLERRSVSLDFKYDSCLQKLSKNDVFKMFHLLGDQVLFLWNIMLKFHRENKIKILEYLRDEWSKERRAEWSIWMVYSKVEMPHHYINGGFESHHVVCKKGSTLWKLTDDPAQLAAMRADLHRRSIAQMRMNNRSIQDMNIFRDPLKVPIVIVERVMNAPRRTFSHNSYLRNLDLIDTTYLLTRATSEVGKKKSTSAAPQNGRDLKIAVFVHGFQGHHLDLRLVRNQWLLIDPKIQFLMSEVNEDKTSGDFKEMGLRLAQEVVSFIEKKTKKLSRSGRLRDIKLSFVGHSIGNIILRTALADSVMEPYLKYLYTYVSVSGPHLGYLYSSNSLFNSGLWLLKKLKGTQCIHQLTFTDNPDLRNTFFYKLCGQTTLENFKHIILLCSPQDGYVPYHSARIETCRAASMDNSKKGKVFLEMLNNCLDQIRRPTSESRVFMRCDVSFDTTAYGRNLNTLIGRAAHIEFLETDIFARFIMWSFPDLFR